MNIEHVASTTHNESLYDDEDDEPQIQLSEGLVRLNIGLEPHELIIKDLTKMFNYLRDCKKKL